MAATRALGVNNLALNLNNLKLDLFNLGGGSNLIFTRSDTILDMDLLSYTQGKGKGQPYHLGSYKMPNSLE